MTKTLIIIAIVTAVALGGWKLFDYWEQVSNEKENAAKEAAASTINPNSLPGMDGQLQPSLDEAERNGPAALRKWLAGYGRNVQDPRLAWIQLDYCVMAARDNLADAKRMFAAVKDRTPPTSPVWPRVKELEKSYQ